MRRFFALALAITMAACAAPERWERRLDIEHALVGRIYDVSVGSFLSPEQVVERLRKADFVLLGEKHDNPDHQRLAANLVRLFAGSGKIDAVGFEFVTSDKQAAIDAGSHVFGRAFAPYQRIADVARDNGTRIVALNAPDESVRDARTKGLDALGRDALRRLALDQPLDPATERAIAKDMRDSHCGMLPETAIAGMVAVQRLWDAHMAEVALAARREGRVVAVVGAGHARRDRGIPAAVRRIRPGTSTLALAFVEVSAKTSTPEDYASNFDVASLPFDFVWFTPRASDGDPCAAFRRRPS